MTTRTPAYHAAAHLIAERTLFHRAIELMAERIDRDMRLIARERELRVAAEDRLRVAHAEIVCLRAALRRATVDQDPYREPSAPEYQRDFETI